MQYKEDLNKTKERFDAFWENEIIDRCCFAVCSPNGNGWQYDQDQPTKEQKWLDIEYRYNRFQKDCECTYFGGEAFPHAWSNFGPGVIANFVGSEFLLDDDTIWFDRNPLIKDIETFSKLEFDKKSILWEKLMQFLDKFYKSSNNNYFVGVTDLGGSLDVAAHLRGCEQLMLDMYDNPEFVLNLCEQIDDIWLKVFKDLLDINNKYQEGYTTWEPVWCKDVYYPLQCDISVMLSPKLFEKFAKESLAKMAKKIGGNAMYHLDGPGQIVHLDSILEIPEIKVIEWVPMYKDGYLDAANEEYFDMYRKIQKKGKGLVLRSVNPALVEKLLENLSPKGLFISTWVNQKEEADYLIKCVEKCSVKKL